MNPVKIFQEFNSVQELYQEALRLIMNAAVGAFRIAVSGGSSAKIFNYLPPNYGLEQWSFYQVDERFVPRSHPDSNFRLLQEVTNGRIVNFTAFPIGLDLSIAALSYAQCLIPDTQGYLFDSVILGVGQDGHTASLFPYASTLDSSDFSLVSHTDSFAVPERLTLGFAALARSRKIFILLSGQEKRAIYQQLQQADGNYYELPICRLLTMDYPTPQAELYFFYATDS